MKEVKDLVEYIHPWCSRLFLIEKEFLDIEGNPEMCCMSCAEKKPTKCEAALRNWKKI
jgi:hypothetical protein